MGVKPEDEGGVMRYLKRFTLKISPKVYLESLKFTFGR